jgi:hypothetical protein
LRCGADAAGDCDDMFKLAAWLWQFEVKRVALLYEVWCVVEGG